MLNEQDIQTIQATDVDRQTAELLAADQYARRRAEQLLANQQAAGVQPLAMSWQRLGAIPPWPSFPASCELTKVPLPQTTGLGQHMATDRNTMSSPPSSACDMCAGAGFYKLAVPVGHPLFGRLQPCACTLAARAQRAAEQLQVLDSQLLRYRACRLTTFDLQRPIDGPLDWEGQHITVAQQRQALYEAHRIASAYAAQPQGWLYLYGPPGSGKTRLAASIANAFRDQGIVATYGRIQALLDWLKASFRSHESADFAERLRLLERAPVLLLDDLGTEHGTNWECTIIENLLNERYNRELPTILTSNTWRDALTVRIADRIAEQAQVIWLLVGSYRRVQCPATQQSPTTQPTGDPWDRGAGEG